MIVARIFGRWRDVDTGEVQEVEWPTQAVADWVVALTRLVEDAGYDAYIQGTYANAVVLAHIDHLSQDGEATDADRAERENILMGALRFSVHLQVRAMEARRKARLIAD